MRINNRVTRAAGATALAMVGLCTVGGTAHATVTPSVSCESPSVWTKDPISAYFTTGGYLQSGPDAACSDGRAFIGGFSVTVYCYYMNQYDDEWLYVSMPNSTGSPTYGWTLASDVDYNSPATAEHC